jgi:hypothetical protein
MKIKFLEVNGHVAIDDRHSFRDATSGMVLETEGKPYIVIVGNNSKARVIIESKDMTLGANSVMHVNHPRPSPLDKAAHDLRILAGKIWMKIDRGEWKPEDGNAAVGVRG